MMNTIRRVLAGGLALVLAALALEAAVMPVSQVKAGMTGKGKTVFQGNAIQEFDVEIIGVLPNQSPKKNIILARLKGQGLENTGVIQGMSGSPVYIDGKLIGAVAYSFAFSKEPIAGITPIEEMLDISGDAGRPPAAFAPGASVVRPLSLEDFLDLNKDFFAGQARVSDGSGRVLAPVGIPLVCRGFSPAALDKTRPVLSRMGFFPVGAAALSQSQEAMTPPDMSLHEGDPVAVQLVTGDLDLSAVGTVTHVDGNKVYAFGHPLYNLGTVDYAMSKAKVLAVVPSVQSSFKLAAPDVLLGRFSQDRSSGAYGEIGKMPKFIPVNIRIQDAPLKNREFKIRVVNDRILGPFFMSQALSALFASAERSVGDLTLSLEGDIYLEDGRSIHLEDMYSGNFDSSVAEMTNLVLAVSYFLVNNEFQAVGLHRIDLNIKAEDQPRFCYLERVMLDKYEVGPNDVMTLKLNIRTFRGESLSQEIPLPVPALPAGSEFQLVLGDAATMMQLEAGLYRTSGFVPRSFAQLVRLLNNIRKNNRIYIKVVASRPGLFLRGEEMPNLPLTIKFLFGSARSAATATELSQSTLSDYQLPLEYIFKGSALIPVKIKK
jgi:hypothetical protein